MIPPALLSFPRRRPFLFGVTVATFKAGAVDYCVQTFVEKREETDWRRVSVFTAFGFVFTGCWQYLLFVKVMPKICPNTVAFVEKPFREKLRDTKGLKELAIQNFAENGINNPFLFFPIFYTIQEFLYKGWTEGRVMKGLKKYASNAHEDVPAIWALWIPAQFINFAFSPLWFRVPYIAAVSTAWTAFVSITRGGSTAAKADP
jgi:hypothetical protein